LEGAASPPFQGLFRFATGVDGDLYRRYNFSKANVGKRKINPSREARMTAALSSPRPTRPLVRIRRAPALEPPTDGDRRADDHPVCAGQLALFTSLGGPSAASARHGDGARRLRASPGRAGSTAGLAGRAPAGGGGVAADDGPATATGVMAGAGPATGVMSDAGPATATGAAGPPTAPTVTAPPAGDGPSASAAAQIAASRFVACCVEVLNGFRPAGHLRALTTPFDYATVATQLTRRTVRLRMPAGSGPVLAAGRTPGGIVAGSGTPTGAVAGSRTPTGAVAGSRTPAANRAPGRRGQVAAGRVDVRRIRVFEQRSGVAEAVAVLRHGEAAWAMALRFERRRGNWLCTLLEVV
jgi:hypothetical protein